MKQKILIYCTQLMPSGGIEYHILEFCKNMSAQYELDILVANFNMPEQKALLRKHCSNVMLVKPGPSWKRYPDLLKILISIRKTRYDILYTNGIGISVLLISKLVNYNKWVLHHHMAADDDFFATLNTKYKRAMVVADHVIACSRINADNLGRLLKRHIDVVFYFSRYLGNNIKPATKNDRLQFGYYGRLIHAKGIDLICRLSEDPGCSDISFHIWGSGNEYPEAYFKQHPSLFYHGSFNTEAELGDVVASLDAFLLLTTHDEGLPVSLLEIMSAGVPWISADKGGIADIVCDPLSTRLVDVSDYEMVRQLVLSMAKDIGTGRITKHKQQELYEASFSSSKLIHDWKAVYDA